MLEGVTPQWLQGMFGRIARRYDLTNTIISAGLDTAWRRRLARTVTSEPVRLVLDVACGTGGVMRQVARLTPVTTHLVGVDFTEAMLRTGQRHLARSGLQHRTALYAGDAQHLPFADHRFDAVTVMFGVRNLVCPLAGLAECYRVLRPGGVLHVVEFGWPHAWGIRLLYGVYFRYLLPLIAWPLAGEHSAYRYLRDSVLAFREQPGLVSLLRRAGFVEVYSTPLSGGITVLAGGRKAASSKLRV